MGSSPCRDEAVYNRIQEAEFELFFAVMPDIVRGVVDRPSFWCGEGRRPLHLYDVLLCLVIKVYFRLSHRRCHSYCRFLVSHGIIAVKLPSFKSLGNYLNDARLRPYLEKLIEFTARFFSAIERSIATDGTGISTETFSSWYSITIKKETKRRDIT